MIMWIRCICQLHIGIWIQILDEFSVPWIPGMGQLVFTSSAKSMSHAYTVIKYRQQGKVSI